MIGRRLALALLASFLAAGSVRAGDAPRLEDFVSAGDAFAADLYREIASDEKGNLFFSPHSISSALVMTYAGARGETASEMARSLHIENLGDHVHELARELDVQLASRERIVPEAGGDPFRLRTASAIWAAEGLGLLAGFVDLVARNHGAGIQRVDFAGDPEKARLAINSAIAQATEKRIPELLQSSDVSRDTRLVLTNAIYFKASWIEPFEEASTREGEFHRDDGKTVTVPYLRRNADFAYFEEDGLQAIEIPYVGGEVGFVVCLPATGALGAFEREMTGERLAGIAGKLTSERVDLSLPRFETWSRLSLGDQLRALGMVHAFDPALADFSGMTGARDLKIDSVIHQSFVAIDEKGTEAAAATAVIMGPTGMPPQPVSMSVDRPFVFFIRDRKTGAILFLGRITDPTVW